MSHGSVISALAGTARLAPYLDAVGGDHGRACDLYLWANDLAGALHSTVAFVEVSVRNAMNRELRIWNSRQGSGYGADWALRKGAAPLLYQLVTKNSLEYAQNCARKEAGRRPKGHPRYRVQITHDDVVSQLMFGTWVSLIHPRDPQAPQRCAQLWKVSLCRSFPHADPSDSGRKKLGKQLERVRKLRNRVAHHDSLLDVEVLRRLNDMLAVLRAVDSRLPSLAMTRNRIRSILKEDPRRKRGLM